MKIYRVDLTVYGVDYSYSETIYTRAADSDWANYFAKSIVADINCNPNNKYVIDIDSTTEIKVYGL